MELPSAAARYLPKLNLTAVFPFPNRSYTTAPRGVMSSYRVPLAAATTICVGTKGFGPIVCSGNEPAVWSHRTAPDTVSRSIVHCSCAYSPCTWTWVFCIAGPTNCVNVNGTPLLKLYAIHWSFIRTRAKWFTICVPR